MGSSPPLRGDTGGTIERLLIVTDEVCAGRSSLALPFRRAIVRGSDEVDRTLGGFDAATIEVGSLGVAQLIGLVQRVRTSVEPGGRIIVVLAPDGAPADLDHDSEPAAAAGLSWLGLVTIDARPCAVLGVDESTATTANTATMSLLAAAYMAARLQSDRTAQASQAVEYFRSALVAAAEARRRSESALILRVGTLTGELDRVLRQHRGKALVTTVLGRSRPGRVALRLVRPAWRLMAGLRSRAR